MVMFVFGRVSCFPDVGIVCTMLGAGAWSGYECVYDGGDRSFC